MVDDDSGSPVHEFALVKDTIRAEGPRPTRFIFNKLTATRDGEAKEQTTHSLTRTTAKSADSDDPMMSGVCFHRTSDMFACEPLCESLLPLMIFTG